MEWADGGVEPGLAGYHAAGACSMGPEGRIDPQQLLPGNAPVGFEVNLMAAPRHKVLGYCGEARRVFTALR